MSKSARILLLLMTCIALSLPSYASGWMWGCWVCQYDPEGLTGPGGESCDHVSDGEYGDGIQCKEEWFVSWTCFLNGGSCYYAEFDGGGGSGGGGEEENGECAWTGGGCPAYCSICT